MTPMRETLTEIVAGVALFATLLGIIIAGGLLS